MRQPVLVLFAMGCIAIVGLIVEHVIENPTPALDPVEIRGPEKHPLWIVEVAPFPTDRRPAFVEIQNRSDEVADISGFVIATGPESQFTFADSNLTIQPQGHLLLMLDDRPDQRNGQDESITIVHGPQNLAEPWLPSAGQVLLQTPDGMPVSCVVWGAPAADDTHLPGIERLWRRGWFVHLHDSFGLYEVGTPIGSGASIGLYPRSRKNHPDDWSVYDREVVSPGVINPVPQPGTFTTPDGATIDVTGLSIAWKGRRNDARYEFQLADAESFLPATIVDQGRLDHAYFEPDYRLDPGAYYFRVRAVSRLLVETGENIHYGKPLNFVAAATPPATSSVELKAQHLVQRKDSPLLCLDGCGQEVGSTVAKSWKVAHPNVPPAGGDHAAEYCGRAAVSMIVSNYGGNLSQDRIAMYTQEELCNLSPVPSGCADHCWNAVLKAPEGDLAHNRPIYCPTSGNDCPPVTRTLEWALNSAVDFVPCVDTDSTTTSNKCDNVLGSHIKGWIDAGRPILARLDKPHFVVLNGYRDALGGIDVLIHDPLEPSPGWHAFNSAEYKGFWLGPKTASGALENAAWWYDDIDGDGIVDFDEINRFPTDPKMPDSDGDGVVDLNDLRGYVFLHTGDWDAGGLHTATCTTGDETFEYVPDVDGDALRKEVDPDNDNDGCPDGVEDGNGNGVFERTLGESNNFVTCDCKLQQKTTGCRCR